MVTSPIGRMVTLLLALLMLPAAAYAQQSPLPASLHTDSGWQRLWKMLGIDSGPELLPPDQAFVVTLKERDANSMLASFWPAKGYYLYRDRISFTVLEPAGMQVANVILPTGELKADPTFGKVEVYHQPFKALVNLNRIEGAPAAGRLQFSYQGCSDSGVCYPPVVKTFDFVLPAMSAAASELMADVPVQSAANDMPGWLNADRSAELFAGSSFALIVAAFFGFGLLLSLTPCVWPMVPILSGIIAGQGAGIRKSHAFWLSAAYVLGMAVVYALAGIAAGLSGSLLSMLLQTPWVLAAMAGIFVLLALSMFGVYEMQLPSFLQSRLAVAGDRLGKRTAASVFAMGGISAIIVGPCVAAPLAGALLYISQTSDIVLGGSALFALALGKGVPLLVVGTSLGSLLPRAGAWMSAIKVFLGVLLLGGALWMIAPFLPLSITMGLTGVVLIGYGVYLRAFNALPAQAGIMAWTSRFLGMIGLVIGAIYLAGAFSGSRDFLQPLSGFASSDTRRAVEPLPFTRIGSVQELNAALQQASGRYVLLDFYADWCVSCKEMEYFTLSDPVVRSKLQNVLLLQADVTANTAADKALLARFQLFGPPGIIFFDGAGQEIRGRRVIGYMGADRFVRVLNEVFPYSGRLQLQIDSDERLKNEIQQ